MLPWSNFTQWSISGNRWSCWSHYFTCKCVSLPKNSESEELIFRIPCSSNSLFHILTLNLPDSRKPYQRWQVKRVHIISFNSHNFLKKGFDFCSSTPKWTFFGATFSCRTFFDTYHLRCANHSLEVKGYSSSFFPNPNCVVFTPSEQSVLNTLSGTVFKINSPNLLQ